MAQLVTASYFSQVPARARHFLIETAADETAVDEAASLNQNKPDREVGSLNGLNRQLSQEEDWECAEECFKSKGHYLGKKSEKKAKKPGEEEDTQ